MNINVNVDELNKEFCNFTKSFTNNNVVVGLCYVAAIYTIDDEGKKRRHGATLCRGDINLKDLTKVCEETVRFVNNGQIVIKEASNTPIN